MLSVLITNQFFLLMFFLAVASSFVLTWLVLMLALRLGWTTPSNERSSHVGQLAYGGGISVIAITLVMWVFVDRPFSQIQVVVLLGAIVLAGVSWFDDLKHLSFELRMGVHLGVVVVCLMLLPSEKNIMPFDWPIYVDRILTGFFWIWFINLFNFMDGIDGLAGVEAIFVGLGVLIVSLLGSFGQEWQVLALVLVGAVLGFLPWNWHRARIMLGDVGAVPLGFLLGFLLIQLALEGYWLTSLILPLYFIVDATITILLRLQARVKIWEPHRMHFYQRASSPTQGHDLVVVRVIIANIALIGASIMSLKFALAAGVLAVAIVTVLLYLLIKMAKD